MVFKNPIDEVSYMTFSSQCVTKKFTQFKKIDTCKSHYNLIIREYLDNHSEHRHTWRFKHVLY